ncbi:MAG: 3-oxoacyl-[acyl-carrier-protein] reductase [Eubacteriales bacterium]
MHKGKVVVVTGGSRGIGRAIARTFAEAGADVALLYAGNTAAAGEALAEVLAFGHRACAYRCDVSDGGAVAQTFTQILADFGRVDVLVNNAGITRDKLALMMKEEDFARVLDTNLTGAFLCVRAVLPGMVKQRAGKIINISSVAGLVGNPGQVNYAAAKAGLVGMSKSLARELAPRGITCNVVAPGFVETEMTAALPHKEALTDRIPLGRFAQPADIAAVVSFLASAGADYITGEVIRVDGGLAM